MSTHETRERRNGPRGGRGRAIARRFAWRLSDWTYRAGWAARLARRLGLQGTLMVRGHSFSIPRREGAPPLRLVFASDFHAGPLTDPALLDTACRAIARAAPDLLLLGGDFVYRRARDVDVLARRLGDISPPLGTFAVLGNHDYLGEDEHIGSRLTEAGVTLLTNANVRLPAPHDDLWICGLDDPIYGSPDVDAALDGVDEAGRRIVLMHAPDGLLALGDAPFDLALCGHTHGGQIALPLGVPLVVPTGRLNRRYPHGEFRVGRGHAGHLLVSRGIGCSGLPVRLFASPEIHVCSIVRGDDGSTA